MTQVFDEPLINLQSLMASARITRVTEVSIHPDSSYTTIDGKRAVVKDGITYIEGVRAHGAVKTINNATGDYSLLNFNNGRFNDTPDGDAAMILYDRYGRKIMARHYINNRLVDEIIE